MMILGPSGTGKTQLIKTLLTEDTVFEGGQPGPCHHCYAMWQPSFDHKKRQGIKFNESIPKVDDLQK